MLSTSDRQQKKSASKQYDAAHHDSCVKSIAEILWGSAWADHVEEHRCCSLSGAKIEDVMPPIPAEAYALAERVLGGIEQANPQWGCNWPAMLDAARRADNGWKDGRLPLGAVLVENIDGYREENVERFGNCLAWMATGAGVSWFDDHKKFELHVPLCAEDASFDLKLFADDRCEQPGRARCAECSGYLDESGHCDANGCS